MPTKEEGTPVASRLPQPSKIVHPEPDLAWADELLAWSLDGYLILVAGGERSTATPPVMWRSELPPVRHRYSLHLIKPERFLQAVAFRMGTVMRSVMVRYAGHPEGVAVPVTPLEVPDEQRVVPSKEKIGQGLAHARFIIPFSLRGYLLLVARGETPTPCYEVRWSPQGSYTYMLSCRETGGICQDVISPYMAVETFRAEPSPQTVRIIHADSPEGEVLQVIPLEKMQPFKTEEAPLAH
jgi:hypothetical protein